MTDIIDMIVSNWGTLALFPSLLISWYMGLRKKRLGYLAMTLMAIIGIVGHIIENPLTETHQAIGLVLFAWGMMGTGTSIWITNRLNTAFPYAAVVAVAGAVLLVV